MKIELPEFETQKETIAYLVKNKPDLIDLKKSVVKNWVPYGGLVVPGNSISKSQQESRDTDEVIYRTIIGNTYNWMDSHEDSHLNNCFAASLVARKGRIPHRHDHVAQLTAKVGKFSNVYEQVVNWTDVGVNKLGQTMALLADSEIKRSYNSLIFESYKDGEIDQHSVGMRYTKIILAANDANQPEEYDNWKRYIGLLGNPEEALKKGFVWIVKEAALIEISCVTDGSNPLTGMYSPAKASVIIDPPKSSHKTIYDYLIN